MAREHRVARSNGRDGSDKPTSDTMHPRWDRKRGTPKDSGTAKLVERAHGRYSASEQGEARRKREIGSAEGKVP